MPSIRPYLWIQTLITERGFEDIRDLLAGIVIVSITFLSVICIPFFGSFILILSPLPILYHYLKHGMIHGLIVFIVSLCMVAIILNSYHQTANLHLLFISGALGIALSEVLKKNYPIELTILFPVVMLLLIWSSFILYETFSSGISPWRLIEEYIDSNIQDNIKFYSRLELPDETLSLLKENAKQITSFFVNVFPAIGLISATFVVWINLLFSRDIFQKRSLAYSNFGDLSLWKAPEKLVWLFITSGTMIFIPVEWIRFPSLNIFIVIIFIYLLHGLAISSFFFKRRNIARPFRIIFYLLIFTQQYFTIFVIAAGLFDLWIDFRKYIAPVAD